MRRFVPIAVAFSAVFAAACSAGNSDKGDNASLGDTGETDSGAKDDASSFDVDPGPGLDAGGDSSTFDPDAACAAKSFGGTRIPLALAIVFDESGSMDDGTPSRISIAKEGVKAALSDSKFDDVAVGLFRFGYTSGFSGCTWDTTPTAAPVPLKTGRTALFAEIDKLKASGSTPTYDALNAAYAWLAPKVLAKSPPENGKVAVIVVTDGAPTCGTWTPDDYIALVAKGRTATIDTFFIGLPGSDEHWDSTDDTSASTSAVMSKAAAVGTDPENIPAGCDADPSPMSSPPSKPCFFDMSAGVTTDGLAAALDNIRKATSSCEFILPTGDASYDPTHPGVFVTDGTGTRVEMPKCVDPKTPGPAGCWDWSDAAHTHVKIYGGGCTTVQTDGKAKVDILLPCKVK
jgi:hypothetical protein